MSLVAEKRVARRAREHQLSRAAILEAARRVAVRDGAEHFSLRGVAAEAGFAPAALYGYFQDRDELLLALAAEDVAALARGLRETADLPSALSGALEILISAETIAAATSAFSPGVAGEAERLFNGRLIAALKALSESAGLAGGDRKSQADVVLIASALAGLAMLARTGRLSALGFSPDEVLARLFAVSIRRLIADLHGRRFPRQTLPTKKLGKRRASLPPCQEHAGQACCNHGAHRRAAHVPRT